MPRENLITMPEHVQRFIKIDFVPAAEAETARTSDAMQCGFNCRGLQGVRSMPL
jgi:hypothetical protein